MANVKLVVMYPRPKDIDAFEKIYQNEHVPLAVARLEGKTRLSRPRYWLHRKVLLLSIASQRFISGRWRIWRHAPRQMVGSRRLPMR